MKEIPRRAGATPLFRLSAAQKVVGSLPPCSRCVACRVLSAAEIGAKHFVMQVVLHREREKEENTLPLLKAPSKQPKTTTLQVRLEEEVRHELDRYAEFIGANPSYVDQRSAQAPVQARRRVQTLAGEHPSNNATRNETRRRRSYEDRVTDMKPRPTQFGVRENTASSRQHAPRLRSAIGLAQSDETTSAAARDDLPTQSASLPQGSSTVPEYMPRTAAATGRENGVTTIF